MPTALDCVCKATARVFLMADNFQIDYRIDVTLDLGWWRLEDDIKKAVEIAARHVEADSKQRMENWPAVDTGATVNSIQAKPKRFTNRQEWIVGPTTEYAPFIEFGTANADGSERMGPRPFMIPAAEKERPKLTQAITDILRKLR